MALSADERNQLIAQYAEGYVIVVQALDGISELEMDTREAPGEWSTREIVHHLADSELNASIRIRRLIAEDSPVIQSYDQDLWVRSFFPDRPIEASLEGFKGARAATLPLILAMNDDQWLRSGMHTEYGPFSAESWLQSYGVHAHVHAEQIRRARAGA